MRWRTSPMSRWPTLWRTCPRTWIMFPWRRAPRLGPRFLSSSTCSFVACQHCCQILVTSAQYWKSWSPCWRSQDLHQSRWTHLKPLLLWSSKYYCFYILSLSLSLSLSPPPLKNCNFELSVSAFLEAVFVTNTYLVFRGFWSLSPSYWHSLFKVAASSCNSCWTSALCATGPSRR